MTRAWVVLAALTVLLVAGNLAFNRADHRPPTYDDAWFLENSLIFHHRLAEGGLRSLASAYVTSFGTKAPLLSLVPLPFYVIFGTGPRVALLANVLFLVIANVFLFLLVRRLYTPGTALAAALFFQTMPLAYGLSRVFMADYGLATLTIVWLYALTASDQLRSGPVNVFLGILLGLGLLMKVSFPAFVAGPLLLVLWERWRQDSTGPRRLLPALLTLAVPAVLIAATWYASNLRTILQYAWAGSYGEIGRQYGFGGFGHWLELLINRGTSVYYAVALLLLGAASLVAGVRPPPESRRRAWFCAAWLVPPLLAAAASSNREIRLVAPLLPPLAVLLAAAVARLGRRPAVQIALTILVALPPLRLYAEHTYGPLATGGHYHPDHDHPVEWGPFVLFSRDLGWARCPDSNGNWDQQRVVEALYALAPQWPVDDALRRLLASEGIPALEPYYVVMGVEHPYLNANLLSYLNAYRRYPLAFTSAGYAEASLDRAMERIYRLNARFLVLGEGISQTDLPGFLNQVNNALQSRLERGEMPYRLRAKVSLTHDIKAVLYERADSWTHVSAEAGSGGPSHALPVRFASGLELLGYDWTRQSGQVASLSYYWTVPHAVLENYRAFTVFRHNGHVIALQEGFVGGSRDPLFDWKPGEVVRQTAIIFAPAGGKLEARMWLAPWGLGERHQIAIPHELIHESVLPLRLEGE